MISHKDLTKDDLETICSFPQNTEELFYISPKFEYPLTPDQILKLSENRASPTVIIDSKFNKPIAYVNLYDLNNEDSSCCLGNVIVSQEYRGKGISEYLINTMMDKAINEHGLRKMKLYCHNTNTRALIFYCKQGFKPCRNKLILNQENKKIVAIEMERELI
jgi:ribosomal protein S18 acetylase RimI-like enzyme